MIDNSTFFGDKYNLSNDWMAFDFFVVFDAISNIVLITKRNVFSEFIVEKNSWDVSYVIISLELITSDFVMFLIDNVFVLTRRNVPDKNSCAISYKKVSMLIVFVNVDNFLIMLLVEFYSHI